MVASDEMTADFTHLAPFAQAAAMLSREERIQRLQMDRWIGYSRAQAALSRLESLLTWPSKQRMPNLLIIGPTNNGKSMIIEKFCRKHSVNSGAASDHETLPIVVVQMPTDPSITRFYAMLLSALGTPSGTSKRLADMEQLALRLMRSVGVRILVIDELHNILAGRGDTHRAFLNLLRFLGNELRIPIVGVGTREAYLAIRSDDQLENRFEPIVLPIWQEGEDLCALLASFAVSLPLRRRSEIAHPDMARYILTRSEGTIGEMTRLLTAAAIVAVETGEEAITSHTLTLAAYEAPTERRRMFEREIV